MRDQPFDADLPETLLVKRLTYLAGALETDPAFRSLVLNRLMYLVTRYADAFDQDQFDALVSQYRSTELDIAILRAVADAIEASDRERVGNDISEPNQLPALSRQPQHGEPLFEFLHGHDRYRCELLDHGERYGVEAQFWRNEELVYNRRFDPGLYGTRTPRAMAIAWAEDERRAIEAKKGGT